MLSITVSSGIKREAITISRRTTIATIHVKKSRRKRPARINFTRPLWCGAKLYGRPVRNLTCCFTLRQSESGFNRFDPRCFETAKWRGGGEAAVEGVLQQKLRWDMRLCMSDRFCGECDNKYEEKSVRETQTICVYALHSAPAGPNHAS
jgi:hypothetical protein